MACFQKKVHFEYAQTVDDFNIELEFFQRKKHSDNDIDIVMGENNIYNKLIVMGDILGLADKSNDFANFLTVSRKFNFTCVYVFHTIYLTRYNWQMIFSQAKIFKIFPGSLQTPSVVKMLSP